MSEANNSSSEDVRQALVKYNVAMDELEQAESKVQDALKEVKNCAQSATVNVDGQFFQVRERKDKLYLCELNGKPKGRPKGSKNTKPRKDKGLPQEPSLDFTPENTGEYIHSNGNGVAYVETSMEESA